MSEVIRIIVTFGRDEIRILKTLVIKRKRRKKLETRISLNGRSVLMEAKKKKKKLDQERTKQNILRVAQFWRHSWITNRNEEERGGEGLIGRAHVVYCKCMYVCIYL